MGSTYTGGAVGGAWNCNQEVEPGTEANGKDGGNRLGMMLDIEELIKESFLGLWGSVGAL